MTLEHSQHLDRFGDSTINNPVVAHEKFSKTASGNLRQPTPAIRMVYQRLRSIDEPVDSLDAASGSSLAMNDSIWAGHSQACSVQTTFISARVQPARCKGAGEVPRCR